MGRMLFFRLLLFSELPAASSFLTTLVLHGFQGAELFGSQDLTGSEQLINVNGHHSGMQGIDLCGEPVGFGAAWGIAVHFSLERRVFHFNPSRRAFYCCSGEGPSSCIFAIRCC